MTSTIRFRNRLLTMLATSGLALACGGEAFDDDEADGAGGTGASGGSTGGSGGSTGGSGGSTGGTGGSTGGTGGSTGGTGGSTGGTGGSTGGTGGSTGGVGGTGGDPGCDDKPVPPGGTGGTGTNCFGQFTYTNCYTLEQLKPLLRDCAAELVDGSCPPLRDLESPYPGWNNECTYFSSGPWRESGMCCYEIVEEGGAIGRPFTCGDEVRRAPTRTRSDWIASTAPLSGELNAATRDALCAAWRSDAQLEHASIASFARLTMQLLEHGAPPGLIAASQAASVDEIEHARRCFALASRYSDDTFGPGKLCMDGALESVTLAELAAAAVREGCIGETLASVVAVEQLARATDPDVRDALRVIADDESRHAEFAWRLVQWAIAAGGEEVRLAVEAAFAEHARPSTVAEDPLGIDTDAWHEHGRLTAAETRAVMAAAINDVVLPCARALVGSAEERAPAERARA